MKNELPYFTVGSSYGGNQNHLNNFVMYFGGCAAVTACDSCLYFAAYKGNKELYPYEIEKSMPEKDGKDIKDKYHVQEKEYLKFANRMKPYLKPRFQGINTLKLYKEGIERFFAEHGNSDRSVTEFSGNETWKNAKMAVKEQIEKGFPIPCLVLQHKNPLLRDLVWHWFLLTGYEELEESFFVKVVTYGNYRWITLKELWDTGHQNRGGLILFH